VAERELTKELDNAIDTSDVKLKWTPDPRGYFTIKPFPSRNRVFVRHYDSNNNLKKTFAGITTLQIIQRIIDKSLISRLDHAAYLGKEIEKAIIALKNDLDYVQDEELIVSTDLKTKK
jgi:tetrahydromethanopterin S-methyltransferase subunit A